MPVVGRDVRAGALIVSTLVGSWLGMQAVHELGHVIGAGVTGATVERVVLHPLQLSRTDVVDNPHPLVVAWAGPLLGSMLPLLVWGIAAYRHAPLAFLARFFAAFCLVANGVYIGTAAFARVGDGATLLALGSPRAPLLLFAVLTAPLGLFLWHGEGLHFGLGPHARPVSASAIVVAAVGAGLLIALGCYLGRG